MLPPIPGSAFRVFRPPLLDPLVPVRETPSVSFADLVRLLAEGIADAQTSLDRASASLVAELANTPVSIIPRVEEVIAADGSVTYTPAEQQEVSLLDLGVMPTFYQFSEAKVEVTMDVKIVENETLSEQGQRRFGLFADTASVRFERKLNRDVTNSSKLTATLVPVPMPLRLEPVRSTTTPEP
jgi:hypothetical protein